MKVLIVYDLIPEETRFFEVLMEECELLEKLRQTHGVLGNCADNTEKQVDLANWVSEYLELLTQTEIENGHPFNGPFDEVIYTGFIL